MSTDNLRRMAEIREMQGLEPLPDPGKIQGFEEGTPPPPPFPTRPPVDLSQVPDAPLDEDPDFEPESSPLIPAPTAPAQRIIEPSRLPVPDLAVAAYDSGQRVGSYRGREVELTEQEAVAVKRVVLRALQRQVRAQLAEVEALLPKRTRRKKAKFSGREVAGDIIDTTGLFPEEKPAPPKRRRGRPRKVQP